MLVRFEKDPVLIVFIMPDIVRVDLVLLIVVRLHLIYFISREADIALELFYHLGLACRDFPGNQSLILVQCDDSVVDSLEGKIARRPLHSKELDSVLVQDW